MGEAYIVTGPSALQLVLLAYTSFTSTTVNRTGLQDKYALIEMVQINTNS